MRIYCQKGWGKCMHHHRHSSAAGIATICRYDCITFGEFSPICSLCATSAVRSTAAQGDDDLFFLHKCCLLLRLRCKLRELEATVPVERKCSAITAAVSRTGQL